jgi:hypothetical protein
MLSTSFRIAGILLPVLACVGCSGDDSSSGSKGSGGGGGLTNARPSGPGRSRSLASGGRKMYFSSASRPCSSAGPARVAACRLKPVKSHRQVAA